MPFVESKGARIFYDVIDRTAPWCAEPETVVFNHGIGIDHRMWTKWIPALIDRYRLVLLDMRGFGRSSVPPADAAWSMDLLAGDLFAVARAAGAGRFHFVGESMGGTVGLCSYFHDPKSIRTITVSNGAHIGATLRNLNDWRDVIRDRGMTGWSAMMTQHRFYDDGLEAAERAWFSRAQEACSADSCLNALGVLRGVDLTAKLSEIPVPVLLLHGDSSPFIPASITADLHAGLPDSEMQIFRHAKHGLPLSHGAQCSRALRAFLDRRTSRH
jgi:pimeloyl-ACP methyl ester carboxylesterase